MAIWRKWRTTWKKLERVFCHWIYFHLSSKIFLWPSDGGHRPHGFVTDWDFSKSQSYTCWQHLAVKSTSRLGLCDSLWKTRFHTRRLRAAHQRTKAKCKVVKQKSSSAWAHCVFFSRPTNISDYELGSLQITTYRDGRRLSHSVYVEWDND